MVNICLDDSSIDANKDGANQEDDDMKTQNMHEETYSDDEEEKVESMAGNSFNGYPVCVEEFDWDYCGCFVVDEELLKLIFEVFPKTFLNNTGCVK